MDRRKKKLMLTVVALLLVIFDVCSDWYALSDFIRHKVDEKDNKLTIALGVICALSTVLFVFEVYNCVRVFKTLKTATESSEAVTPEEKSLERWQEIVTFFQIIVEDFPVTIVMYVTFRSSSCGLFMRIFEEGFTGNLALLAAFLSSLWKLLSALCYCCCAGYEGIRCSRRCCCCCCRTLRATIAILLMGFAAFLFFTFNKEGTKYRGECLS